MTAQAERIVFMRGRDRDYTAHEYMELCKQKAAAEARGDVEEYERLSSSIPMSPRVVKAFKEVYGKDFILSCNFDLTEANLQLGEGWLDEEDGQSH